MLRITVAALAMIAMSGPVLAANVSVEMLNKHPETKERNVFVPALVKIQGDVPASVENVR